MKVKDIDFLLSNPYLRYTFIFGLTGLLFGSAIGTVYGFLKNESEMEDQNENSGIL